MMKTRFPSIGIRSYKKGKKRENEPSGTGLEAEVPIWMHKIYIHIMCTYIYLLFSCPVMFDSLQPHGLHHTRPPCPSPSLEVCPSSCPLYWWCHPAISSSNVFSFCPQSFPASRTFAMSRLFGDQILDVSASVLPMSIQGWFPLRLAGFICLLPKGLSGVFSSTTVRRHHIALALCLLYGTAFTTVHNHWEDHILDNVDLCQEEHNLDYADLCQNNVSAFQHTA